jgi:DNA-binding beta-propeller fold protein YncE
VPEPGGIDVLLRVRGLAVSPDGANVYAASVGSGAILSQPASVVVFTRAAATGRLTFLESQKEGVDGVSGIENCRDVAVSPDGANVYAAGGGATDPGLATFARDPATGALTWLDARPIAEIGAAQPNGLAVTPDGAWVLLVALGSSGSFDSRLVVYARDPDTGLLTRVQDFADDTDGVDGLRGAFQVAVSPDGASAYLASEQDAPPGMPPSGGDHGGAVAGFRVPEPDAGPAAAALALAALAARRRTVQRGAASQSRGRRKTS